MRNRPGRATARADLHEHGTRRQRVREPHHLGRHRRREEHGLPRRGRRKRFRDLADVGPEAHVHHAVRFVEDEDFQFREVANLAPHVIEQASGRRDDDLDAGLQRTFLRLDRNAAVHRGARHRGVICEALYFVVNLRDELARGRQHERANRSGGCRGFTMRAHQPIEDRQEIRRRLAGAGLRAPDDVASSERIRQHRTLDRGRLLVPALFERVEQFLIGDEGGEGNRGGIVRSGFARRRAGWPRRGDGRASVPGRVSRAGAAVGAVVEMSLQYSRGLQAIERGK